MAGVTQHLPIGMTNCDGSLVSLVEGAGVIVLTPNGKELFLSTEAIGELCEFAKEHLS